MEVSIRKKSIRANILKIAGPVFIELLLGTLFGMIDMIMLGNSGDMATTTSSIAAVGVTNQLIFIGLSLVQALNAGATAMVARYMGAKREDKIESVVKHIIILTQIFLVIPILIMGLGLTDTMMTFLGAHQDTIAVGRDYFRVVTLSFIFQAFNFSIVACLRGAGDTKTPMKINLTANFINVFGNAILIFGLLGFPALGATGAGISTALSQVVATILLVRYFLKKDSTIQLTLKDKFKFDKEIMYNVVKIGLPAALEQVAFRAGILIFTKMVASLGTIAYATHQICINILNISFTPGQSFGIAASTLAGKSLGAQEHDLAEDYIKECSRIGAIIASIMAMLFFFFGPFVAGLYSNSNEVVTEASDILKLVAFIQPFQTSQLITSGGLRGAGDTIWTLVASFIGVLGVRLIFAYYFVTVLGMGLKGAWLAILIDQLVRWIVIKLRFKTNKWKYITIR